MNIIAEADLTYPLQTKISDLYPTKTKKPSAMPKIDTENNAQYVASPINDFLSCVSIFVIFFTRV